MPNFRYLVNLTDNGREIGIYKNGKLYKYSYDCSVSGATKLNNSVLYFVSLEGSSYSLQRLDSVSQINSAGVSLYCDGENVKDVLIGFVTDGAQQSGDRQFLFTVDIGVHHVVDVGRKFHPRTLERNDTGRIQHGAVGMLALTEKHARRTV